MGTGETGQGLGASWHVGPFFPPLDVEKRHRSPFQQLGGMMLHGAVTESIILNSKRQYRPAVKKAGGAGLYAFIFGLYFPY